MAFVYLVDTLSYEARGGTAEAFATLEGAKASRPWVTEWTHRRTSEADGGEEYWIEARVSGVADAEEIRRVEVRS